MGLLELACGRWPGRRTAMVAGETKNSALRKTGRKRMSAIDHYR
jgi:hypothetical protein